MWGNWTTRTVAKKVNYLYEFEFGVTFWPQLIAVGLFAASTVRELEGVVEKQAQAMKLLNQQCQNLTHTLEDTTAHHK